jgi:hypothetical protein
MQGTRNPGRRLNSDTRKFRASRSLLRIDAGPELRGRRGRERGRAECSFDRVPAVSKTLPLLRSSGASCDPPLTAAFTERAAVCRRVASLPLLVQTSSHDKTTGSEQHGHCALLRPWLLHRPAKQERSSIPPAGPPRNPVFRTSSLPTDPVWARGALHRYRTCWTDQRDKKGVRQLATVLPRARRAGGLRGRTVGGAVGACVTRPRRFACRRGRARQGPNRGGARRAGRCCAAVGRARTRRG